VDHFSLAGNGPVHIVAGFVGSITYSATTFTITPSTVIGDPIGLTTTVNTAIRYSRSPRPFGGGAVWAMRDEPGGSASRARLPLRWPARLPPGGATAQAAGNTASDLDQTLSAVLKRAGFTGTVESSLPARLGRPVDSRLADLGRVLFFDSLAALHDDNSCAGCHAPATGLGDSQSIAIGIQSNQVVGRHRVGPRNQRRTPTVVNAAFYPNLMWNGRFSAPSADPFDNSQGFAFPLPEGGDAISPP
jgi:hypothetical protein